MSLYENFPYTNFHELNLDWIITTLNQLKEGQVLSVNGMTGDVILYQNAIMQLPTVEDDHWSIIRMADGTQRGIMFANDGTAYIVHGNTMSQVYSVNNQPPYPVTRVNGKTGDITLYTDQYVQLPSLTDAQMHNWTFFRTLNNVSRGIQFDDDDSAYIINGNSRYKIYDLHNTPDIVTRVNGKTGNVVLFNDSVGKITFPGVPQNVFTLQRSVDGTNVSLSISKTGDVSLNVGNDTYPVYTGKDPGWINDPEDDTIIINTEAATPDWGFIRETTQGYVGILFSNDPQLTEPAAYLQYIDSNDQVQTIKLLTTADIPSSSGVVSVNGLTGVVVLSANEIPITPGAGYNVNSIISRFSANFAKNHTEGISYPKGSYVRRYYNVYKANTNTSLTWDLSEWDQVNLADNIEALETLVNGVQTVQKQVSTATTYTCAEAAGEWYTISDLQYTTTKKSLVIINAHLKINSSKQHIEYILSQSWNLANTSGTQHFLNANYAAVYPANSSPAFQIRLENGESITYGAADQRQAGITYTVIPLE